MNFGTVITTLFASIIYIYKIDIEIYKIDVLLFHSSSQKTNSLLII